MTVGEFIEKKNNQFKTNSLVKVKDIGRKGTCFFVRESWTFLVQSNLSEKVFIIERLRDAVKAKQFEVLYIYDLGRLSRNFLNQLILLDEFNKLGIQVISAHDINPENDEETFAQRVLGLAYDLERKKTAEKMRRGKLFKAKNGNVVHGPAPYGYTYIPKTADRQGYYVINEEEAEVVRKIFHLVGDEGLTIRQVIKRLYELKISPRKRKKESWTNGPLCKLLRNESYIGKTYYNKSQAIEPKKPINHDRYKKIKKSSRKLKPREEWIGISIPAIIDNDLFLRVQKQLKINAQFSARNKKHDYLLSGLIYCECGSRMGCEGSGEQYYYRCQNRLKEYPLPRSCFAGGLNTKRIDNEIWEEIKKLLTNPNLMVAQAKQWLDNSKTQQNISKPEKEALNLILNKLGEEERRLIDAYSKGVIPFDLLKERENDIKNRRQSLDSQLKFLNEKSGEVAPAAKFSVEEVCQKATTTLSRFAVNDQRTVLLKLVENIVVNKERNYATIKGYIPLSLEENQNYGLRTICRDCGIAECGKEHFI